MTVQGMTLAARNGSVPPFETLSGLARHISVAGVTGVVTGLLVGGLGGRLFMRVAGAAAPDVAQGATTEAGFTVGKLTLDGTLGLVTFIGVLVGIVGAVMYLVFRPWLGWAGRWRGVAFGLLLFAVGSATSDVLNPDNFDFSILGNSVLLVVLIVGLFVGFGAFMDWMFGILDRRLPAIDNGTARWVYAFLALVGAGLGAVTAPFLLFSRQACDCDPPIVSSVFVVVAAAGTLVWWWHALRPNRFSMAGMLLGFVGLAGATVFGLTRALSDAIEIIS
jgi:hypothetical protein